MGSDTRAPMNRAHDIGAKSAVYVVALKAAMALGLDPEMAAYAALAVQQLGSYIGATLRDGEFLSPTDATGFKRFALMLGRNVLG